MARMYGQLVAVFCTARRLIDVREIQLRMNALCIEIHRERHDVHVPSALAISEQRAFDAIGSCHHCKLGSCNGRSAIIVRVHRQDYGIAIRDTP
jgi:hypothetical protein